MLPRGAAYPHHDAAEVNWVKVTIPGKQGQICAEIRHTTKSVNGVMILAHPYKAEAKRYFTSHGLADWYLSEGWTVIAFDFNGFGESTFTGFQYDQDIHSVLAFAREAVPGVPLGLHGISFGAAQSLAACGKKDHGISFLVVENCLDNYLSYFQKRNTTLYSVLRAMHAVRRKKQVSHNYIVAASHVQSPVDVLFIYCQEDKLTTYAMGRQLMEALPLPSSMLVCKGKHLEAFAVDKIYYTRQLRRFLLSGN